MIEVIFHVGMGKTGTTSLQHSLEASADVLLEARTCYLGMWQDLISETFAGYAGFQTFRHLPDDEQRNAADKLAERLLELAATTGVTRFLFSNEQYFENVDQLHPFFERLQSHVNVRFFVWVRPVTSWLPSACAQWGILHKTNAGPVRPFVEQADRLIQQYRYLPKWTQRYGKSVKIWQFRDGTDPVADLAAEIGVPLFVPAVRRQTRPDPVELLLRAAFNTQFDDPVLPEVFNEALGRHQTLTTAQGLKAKAEVLLSRDAIPAVIARHRDLLERASAVTGFDVIGTPDAARQDDRTSALADLVLGRAIEIIAGQARDLADLRARLEALEARLPN